MACMRRMFSLMTVWSRPQRMFSIVTSGNAERPVEDTHHLADHDVLHERKFALGHRLGAQPFDFGVNLAQGVLRDLRPDLCRYGEIALPFEVDHGGHHAVRIAVLLAQVLHQARTEITAQGGCHDLHAEEIGMLAREKQPSDADRRLYGARMVDPHFVLRHGAGNGMPAWGSRRGNRSRQRRDGLPFVVADVARWHIVNPLSAV